jgi:hypothetical protein
MLIDLITYTTHSPDGTLSAEALIERARTTHLSGLCITDREHSKDAARWVAMGQQAGIFVGVGVEILSEEGLIIGLPPAIDEILLQERWRNLSTFDRPSAQSVIDYFDAIGGATILGPIYDQRQPLRLGDQALLLQNFSAIDALCPTRTALENDLALEVALALNLPPIAASRALTSLTDMGKLATVFTENIADQATLTALLRAGDVWPVRLANASEPRRSPDSDRPSSDRPPRRPSDSDRPSSDRPPRRPSDSDRNRSNGDRNRGGDRSRPRDQETEQPERRRHSRRFMLD